MSTELKLDKFVKYALFVLAYNVVVILWGVFLRASKSGDGCGQHWLTCHGEVLPSAPEMKTVIEFSHRLTSGLAFIAVLILVIWAFRKFPKGDAIRKTALISFIFIITEALVGAGLVLTGNTAETLTPARPFWAAGHLTNTFILLAFLTLTAWFASGGKTFNFQVDRKVLLFLALAIAGIFFVGVSGSMAALSSMLFPSESLAEGIQKDFSSASHILLRLRISHPISSIVVGVFLIFLAGWFKSRAKENVWINRWTNALTILIIVQLAFGALTLLTLAPIVMQLGHLLLADAVWIVFVLMSASVLAHESEASEFTFPAEAQGSLS
ncbi:MAG TPA: COX15/CtaA family protein [Pyrinomonadaceae bacterium]|nr:COX15/CtaA family protein [Pyrinomonadaceae bacterium]